MHPHRHRSQALPELTVSDVHRKRILACSNLDLLRLWVGRTTTIRTSDAVNTEAVSIGLEHFTTKR